MERPRRASSRGAAARTTAIAPQCAPTRADAEEARVLDAPEVAAAAPPAPPDAVADPPAPRLAGAKRPRRGSKDSKLAVLDQALNPVAQPSVAASAPPLLPLLPVVAAAAAEVAALPAPAVAAAAPVAAAPIFIAAAAAAPAAADPVLSLASAAGAVAAAQQKPVRMLCRASYIGLRGPHHHLRRYLQPLSMELDDQIINTNLARMFAHYHSVEPGLTRASECLARQPQLNAGMRAILLDWLIEVARRYRQQPETVFQAVSLVDRFLGSRAGEGVTRDLVLASKLEEAYRTELTYEDLHDMCAGAYTKPALAATEAAVLRALQFRITGPTAYIFLTRLQRVHHEAAPGPSSDAVSLQAQFLLERALLELPLLATLPSLLAAAAMFLALRSAAAVKDALPAPADPAAASVCATPHRLSEACAAAGIGGSALALACVWTPEMAAASSYELEEVAAAAGAMQHALARGVVVVHNITAKVKDTAARAAATARGDAAPAPRSYSHFQMEAVSRKYSKPEVLEVAKLPLAFDVCLSQPPACECACEHERVLRFATVGNSGLVPWAPAPRQAVAAAALFTPQAPSSVKTGPGGSGGCGGFSVTPADAPAAAVETPATLAGLAARASATAGLPSASGGSGGLGARSVSSVSNATTAAAVPIAVEGV